MRSEAKSVGRSAWGSGGRDFWICDVRVSGLMRAAAATTIGTAVTSGAICERASTGAGDRELSFCEPQQQRAILAVAPQSCCLAVHMSYRPCAPSTPTPPATSVVTMSAIADSLALRTVTTSRSSADGVPPAAGVLSSDSSTVSRVQPGASGIFRTNCRIFRTPRWPYIVLGHGHPPLDASTARFTPATSSVCQAKPLMSFASPMVVVQGISGFAIWWTRRKRRS